MGDLLARLLESLIPPLHASESAQYAWRVKVAAMACVSFLSVGTISVLAFGLAPGFAGFARAADLNVVIQEIRANRAEILESEIIRARILHCKAATEEIKQLYWTRLAELLDKYRQATGRPYTLPVCADL